MVYGEWEEVLLLPLCSLSHLHFRIFYHPCFLVFTYDNSHFCVAPFYENNPCHFDTHVKCSNDKGFQEKFFLYSYSGTDNNTDIFSAFYMVILSSYRGFSEKACER